MTPRRKLVLPALVAILVVSLFLEFDSSIAKEVTSVGHGNSDARVDATAGEEAKKDGAATVAQRLREGTQIVDVLGEFQRSADRINFYAKEGKTSYRVLENLALERVARMLEDSHANRLWSVSGTLTEFRGENFLLITRAVVKPKVSAPPRSAESNRDASDDKKLDTRPSPTVSEA